MKQSLIPFSHLVSFNSILNTVANNNDNGNDNDNDNDDNDDDDDDDDNNNNDNNNDYYTRQISQGPSQYEDTVLPV